VLDAAVILASCDVMITMISPNVRGRANDSVFT
jgi:hypothetical protein